jgi:hypothetical protein
MQKIRLTWLLVCCLVASVDAQPTRKSAPSQATKPDFMIVPGKSLGKIKLGMAKKEVIALLGNPHKLEKEQQATVITYQSRKTGNLVALYLEADKVNQIHFTSSAYATQEGITTQNCSEHKPLFNAWKLPVRFVNLKYSLKQGGLTFYNLNADSAHPDYPVTYWGVVHRGQQPRYEVFYLLDEPSGGWQSWNGEDIYAE